MRSASPSRLLLPLVLALFVLGCGSESEFGPTRAPTPMAEAATFVPTPATLPLPQSTPTATPEAPAARRATVVRVIDGDTFEVRLESDEHVQIELLGADAPELFNNRPFEYGEISDTLCLDRLGNDVRDIVAELIDGQTVTLVFDSAAGEDAELDSLLAYVETADGVDVAAMLVEEGLVRAVTSGDLDREDEYVRLQRAAQRGRVGLWGECSTVVESMESPEVSGAVVIECISFEGQVPGTESDEYVQIANLGEVMVFIGDSRVFNLDKGPPRFVFPEYIIRPGERIRVYTNEVHPESGGFSFGSESPLWDNENSETAALADLLGNIVSERSYPPGCDTPSETSPDSGATSLPTPTPTSARSSTPVAPDLPDTQRPSATLNPSPRLTQSPTPTLTPTPTTGPAETNVVTECIFYDGLVVRSEADEYVQIANLGGSPTDLNGWLLTDLEDGNPSLVFPSYVVGPGERVRVYTNQVHPEWGGFSFGSGTAVWNNEDSDKAGLFDPQGIQVSALSYPPGC